MMSRNGCKGYQKCQICNGTILQNKCHEEYILPEKSHVFSKSAQFLHYATLLLLCGGDT